MGCKQIICTISTNKYRLKKEVLVVFKEKKALLCIFNNQLGYPSNIMDALLILPPM